MNTVRISIGGQDFTKFATVPLTLQNTLNDTLDSAQVSLHNMKRSEPFEPMTDAVLTVNGVDTTYKVAGDEVLEVFGAGRFSHTVTLIEYTKEAERLIMEAKAFTRPKIPDYSDGQTDVTVYLWEEDTALGTDGTLIGSDTSSAFASPILKGGAVAIPAISGILENTLAGYGTNAEANYWHITVFRSESPQNVASMEQAGSLVYTSDSSQTTEREAIDLSESGFYYFRYNYRNDSKYYSAMWQVSVVANPVARDPYTVRKVVDTLLTVCEPLRVGDDPRYRLEVKAGQMAVFSQDAPEFHFSNSRTLWENLREVGKYIHAIPRLVPRVGYTAVQYDELGGNQNADTSKGRRVSGSASWDISTYAAGLETMAANLITAENDAQSTICEPFGKGWKSLRTASETARIQEGSAHIETAYPIESVSRVLVYFQYGGKTYQGDITPYVFEKADYDLLSSYTGQYPNSKCFALYYARGSQNISGLWYKPNDEVASSLNAFQNYAIANVCTAATGCSLNIFKQLTYPDICVRVEYIPTITARIHAFKPDAKSGGGGFLSDGQAANRLSAKALGEHLRGQLAMLPSASRSSAWLFKDAGSIPEPGKLIDGQYISVVTSRIYPAYCEVQIDTVKGYNELGSYVELPTAFRQYEIPDSLERFTVLDEFVYISETAEADEADTICSEQLKAAVADALDGVTGTIARRVSLASVTTTDDAGAVIAADVLCPVMSLSVGNAVCFSFRMQDNYSAGNQSAKGGKQYRMTQAVPYGDKYYGTAERLKFSLYASAMSTGVIAGAHAFPATDGASIALGEAMASTGAKPLKWYKDSAEIGNVSYQLHAMTRDGFIIGDMMMAHCSAVRAVDETESPVLYYYAEELNPLTGTNGTETVLGMADSVGAVSDSDGWRISCVTVEPPEGFKSWAIKRGGDFLIGKNSGIVPKNIYLNFKRRIPK